MAEKSPETWLQSELSELLVNIHDALDAWSRLPFDCSWTRKPPASHYLMMLKGMEEQLLRMWVRMQRNQWGILEVEVLAWNGTQKRKEDGVLRNFYDLLQTVASDVSTDKKIFKDLPRNWGGFLTRNLLKAQYLVSRCAQLKNDDFPEELQNLCRNSLKCMQVLNRLEPRELCSSFFTLLSPLTRESIFLADYPSLPQRKLVSSVINRFAENLLAAKDWHSQSEDYLKLLRKQK